MISILSLNPSIDKFISVSNFVCGNTNYAQSTSVKAGGKGINSALSAVKFGVQINLLGFCAISPGIIEQKLESENISYEFITAFDEIRENIKITDRKKLQITEINQKGQLCDSQAVDKISRLCLEAARRSSYFIMAGSIPKGCPESIYRDIILDIKDSRASCRCVVDSSGDPLSLAIKSKPYMIKPNLQELEQLTGRKLPSIDEIEQAALSIINDGVEIVLVSMGCSGALLVTADDSYYSPALLCETINEVGAGDCMLAAMVSSLESGNDLLGAFVNSMAASAACVSSQDGSISDIRVYEDFLNRVTVERRRSYD